MSHFRYSPSFIGPVALKSSAGSSDIYTIETSSTGFLVKYGATTILTANKDLTQLLFGTNKVYHEGNPPPGGGFTGGTVPNDTTFSKNVTIDKYSTLSATKIQLVSTSFTDPDFEIKNQSGDLWINNPNPGTSKVPGTILQVLNSANSVRVATNVIRIDFDTSSLPTLNLSAYNGVNLSTGMTSVPVNVTSGGFQLSSLNTPANKTVFTQSDSGIVVKTTIGATTYNLFDIGTTYTNVVAFNTRTFFRSGLDVVTSPLTMVSSNYVSYQSSGGSEYRVYANSTGDFINEYKSGNLQFLKFLKDTTTLVTRVNQITLLSNTTPAFNYSNLVITDAGITLKNTKGGTETTVFDYGVTATSTWTFQQKTVITNTTDATGDKTGAFQVYGGMSVSKAAVFNDRVVLEVVPEQAAQAAGMTALYGRSVGGRIVPTFRDASMLETQVQAALYNKTIMMLSPASGSSLNAVGTAYTNTGTLTSPTPTATSYGKVAQFATAATAASTAGVSVADAFLNLGSSPAAAGGFTCVTRLRFPDANYGSGSTGARIFIGLTSNALATEVGADDPAGSRIGFALSTNLSETNFMITSKNGTTQTRVSSGVAFSVGALYDFYLGAVPGGTQVAWRITNLTTGVTTEGTITATLPATSTLMRFGFQVGTLTTVARNVHFKKLYVETEF